MKKQCNYYNILEYNTKFLNYSQLQVYGTSRKEVKGKKKSLGITKVCFLCFWGRLLHVTNCKSYQVNID